MVIRHTPALHPRLERVIGLVVTDPDLLTRLLRSPAATVAQLGLPPEDQAIVDDIRAPDLKSFARALRIRLYGDKSVAFLRLREAAGG